VREAEEAKRLHDLPVAHQRQGKVQTQSNSLAEQASERLRSRLANMARTNSGLDAGRSQTRDNRGGSSALRGRGFSPLAARGVRRGPPSGKRDRGRRDRGRRDRDTGGPSDEVDDSDFPPVEAPSVTTPDVQLLQGNGVFGPRKSSELLLIPSSLRDMSLPDSLVQVTREELGGDYSRYGLATRFDSLTSLSKVGPLRHARAVLSHQKDFNGVHRAQVADIIQSSMAGMKQIART